MAWRASRGVLIAALSAVQAAAGLERFESVEPHMGTLARITLYAPDADAARRGFAAAFARIREIDDALSDYKDSSEANRVCQTAWRRPERVSPVLFRVLARSIEISRETGGRFDVTLGPLIRLWRIARQQGVLPARDAVAEARSRCGFANVVLDSRRRTVLLKKRGMSLDFGAIGKGYAADEALAALRRAGINRALVALSGDLAAGDPPPGFSGWRIGVEGLPGPLMLKRAAVSTSGDSEQNVVIGGIRYSHVFDAGTGAGLTWQVRVTVVARRGIDADAYSTAISALGMEEGVAFAERKGIAAQLGEAAGPTRTRALEARIARGIL